MSLYLKTDHVHIVSGPPRMHLAMASTVESQTAEEAKSLSKTESCDRKPVIARSADASQPGILQLTETSISFNV